VTLIAGIRCSDGLVLVSDRQESDGDYKGSVRKIFDYSDSTCQLAIATAGYSALADVAVKRIEEAARAAKFADRHEEIIEAVLRELYERYIWDEEIPDTHEREISLIVGIYDTADRQYRLYRTCEEILQPIQSGYVCAGCGEEMGVYFLQRLYSPASTIHEAMKLMAFVVREAKESVGEVGLETEVVILTESGISRTLAADASVPRLADCVTRFWETKPGTAKIAESEKGFKRVDARNYSTRPAVPRRRSGHS